VAGLVCKAKCFIRSRNFMVVRISHRFFRGQILSPWLGDKVGSGMCWSRHKVRGYSQLRQRIPYTMFFFWFGLRFFYLILKDGGWHGSQGCFRFLVPIRMCCLFFLKILSGQAVLYSVYQLNSHLQFAPVSFFKDLQEGPQRAWIWRVREVASLSACCPHT